MRILFVYKARTNLGMGLPIRINRMRTFLQESGHEVRESCLPSIKADLRGRHPGRVLRSFFPLRKQPIKLLSRDLPLYVDCNTGYNHLHRICKRGKFDLIFSETSLVSLTAIAIGRKLSIPCIADIHGLAGAEARGNGEKNWAKKEELEAKVFRNSDHLLVVSNAMKAHITANFGVNSNKVSVVPNGSQLYPHIAKHASPLKAIYAGIFAYWEKVDDFLNIAREANSKDFEFSMLGAGAQEKQLKSRIRNEKIPIEFLGYQRKEQAMKTMSQMQVGIAPSTKDLARIVAFPIKILDYMACGLPVIAPKIGDWGEMIETEDCGVALKKDTSADYLDALQNLKEKNTWIQKSQNALKAIQIKYDWKKVLSPIEDILREIIRN